MEIFELDETTWPNCSILFSFPAEHFLLMDLFHIHPMYNSSHLENFLNCCHKIDHRLVAGQSHQKYYFGNRIVVHADKIHCQNSFHHNNQNFHHCQNS